LQLDIDGFISSYGDTETLIRGMSVIRAFVGLAIALRVLKIPGERAASASRQSERAYVHRMVGERWEIERSAEIESRHSDLISALVPHDLDGHFKAEADQAAWIRDRLSTIGRVIDAGAASDSVILGAQWLFDSYCGSDSLLQFVQAAVVMEILLGNKEASDQTGLGVLLANRCAYSIAVSHSQRAQVMADFKRIYEVRSKIVHRGKSRLSSEERRLFDRLRWLCRRVIQREAELLSNDTRSAVP
jgi:hypothetical protein